MEIVEVSTSNYSRCYCKYEKQPDCYYFASGHFGIWLSINFAPFFSRKESIGSAQNPLTAMIPSLYAIEGSRNCPTTYPMKKARNRFIRKYTT